MLFYKRSITLTAVLCLFLTSFSLYAQELQWSPHLTQGKLDNGFQYVIHNSQNPDDPFNLRLIVNAGSIDDEYRGMAHIVEHMVFRANRAHDIDMHRMFDQIGWKTGTQINAMTRQTETQYMVRTRPNDSLNASESVQLLSDLAFGAKLLDREWQLERGVILEEMRRGSGVAERVNIAKKKVVRNGSRYVDRPTIGTKEDIWAVEIDDIRAFYDKFYVPGNMTLVASGYFDEEQLVSAIESSFGEEEINPVPDRSYVKLPLKDGLVIGKVQDPKGTTSAVVYGFRNELEPGLTEAGAYQRFQNYFIRKLVRPLVRAARNHYGDTVTSVHITFSEPTNERLIVALAAKTHDHALGLDVVLREIERLKQNGIEESELLTLKEKARASVLRNRKAIPQRGFAKWEDKLTAAIMQGSLEEEYAVKSERTLKWIDALTADELNKRVNEMLTAPDQFMFYQIPGDQERVLPTVGEVEKVTAKVSTLKLDRLEIIPNKSNKKEETTRIANLVDLTKPNLSKARVLSKHKHYSPEVVQWKLANGDEVVWLNRKTRSGEYYIKALSDAGYYSESQPAWLAQAAQQVWQQTDFGDLTSQEMSQWQKVHKANWSWAQKGSELDISAKVKPENLESLMRAYWTTQTQWHLGASEFSEAKDAIKEAVAEQSLDSLARDALWGTPADLHPTQTEIDELTLERFSAVIRTLSRQPVSLFIVGEGSESQIEKAVLPYLASIERRSDLVMSKPVLPSGDHTLRQAMHDEQKSTVTIKSESDMVWTPESSFLVSTLNPVIQKALKNKLRHELGGVYSIRFEMGLSKDNKVRLKTEFTTAPEKVEMLIEAHNRVLSSLPPLLKQENYKRIQQDIKFAESLRLADPNTWLRRLSLSYQKYQSPAYLESMLTLEQQVTEQKLQSILEQIIPLSKQAILIGTPVSEEGN